MTSNDEKQGGDARLHVFAGEININTSAGGSQCDNKGGIENVRPLSDNGPKPGSSPVEHVTLISGLLSTFSLCLAVICLENNLIVWSFHPRLCVQSLIRPGSIDVVVKKSKRVLIHSWKQCPTNALFLSDVWSSDQLVLGHYPAFLKKKIKLYIYQVILKMYVFIFVFAVIILHTTTSNFLLYTKSISQQFSACLHGDVTKRSRTHWYQPRIWQSVYP